MPETMKNLTDDRVCSAQRQMLPAEMVRQRARTLRERSVRLDRLADELDRCGLSNDSNQELMLAFSRE